MSKTKEELSVNSNIDQDPTEDILASSIKSVNNNMWSISYESEGLLYSMTLVADYFEAVSHASRIPGFRDLSEVFNIIKLK